MATKITEIQYYADGKESKSKVLGYHGGVTYKNWVVRFTISTDSGGASRISLDAPGWDVYKGSYKSANLYWHVTGINDTSYVNANGGVSGYEHSGEVTISSGDSSGTYNLSINNGNVALSPNTTYYLWLFPKDKSINTLWYAYYYQISKATFTYSTIPALSSISVSTSSITPGGSIKINIGRQSSAFTHVLVYSTTNPSQTQGSIASNVGASYSWTPSSKDWSNFYDAIGSSGTSYKIKLWCQTYSGSTALGWTSCDLTVKTSSSANGPTVSLTLASSNTTSNLYIANRDTMTITYSSSAKDRASIASVYVSSGSWSTTSTSASKTITQQTPSNSVTVTVTDTRGYTASATKQITNFISYTLPSIAVTSAFIDPSSNVLNFTVKGNIYKGSVNTSGTANTYTVSYGLRDDTSGTTAVSSTTITSNTTPTSGTWTASTTKSSLNYQHKYTLTVTITDKLKSASVSKTVYTDPVFYWGSQSIYLNRATYAKSNLEIAGNLKTSGTATITGNITASNAVSIGGATTIGGALTANGSTTLNGNIKTNSVIDAVGGIKLYGHSNSPGSWVATTTNSVSIASGSYVKVCEISLPVGSWMLTGQVNISANSSGYRWAYIGSSLSHNPNSYVASQSIGSNLTPLHLSRPVVQNDANGNNVTYYLYVYQDSGSALSAYGWLVATRYA